MIQNKEIDKRLPPPFHEDNFGIINNYCDIIPTVKVYNTPLLNRIRPEVEEIH